MFKKNVLLVDKILEACILYLLKSMFSRRNETARICAVLHDAIEYTEITLGYLRNEGFSEKVISVLDALTRCNNEIV